jgi:hypothetical protein
MAHKHTSWIYGVIEREFVRDDPVTVVKLGRVGKRPIHMRLAEYPNNSVPVFLFALQPGTDELVEASLLAAARKKFKARCDIGAEYIEAPVHELSLLANQIASPFLARSTSAFYPTLPEITVPPQQTRPNQQPGSAQSASSSATNEAANNGENPKIIHHFHYHFNIGQSFVTPEFVSELAKTLEPQDVRRVLAAVLKAAMTQYQQIVERIADKLQQADSPQAS